jgi:hypothetical protein
MEAKRVRSTDKAELCIFTATHHKREPAEAISRMPVHVGNQLTAHLETGIFETGGYSKCGRSDETEIKFMCLGKSEKSLKFHSKTRYLS